MDSKPKKPVLTDAQLARRYRASLRAAEQLRASGFFSEQKSVFDHTYETSLLTTAEPPTTPKERAQQRREARQRKAA